MPNAASLVHGRSLKRFLTKTRLKQQGCRIIMRNRITAGPRKRQRNATALFQTRRSAITYNKDRRDILLKTPVELPFQNDPLAIDDDVIVLDPLDFQIEYEYYPLNSNVLEAEDYYMMEQDENIITDPIDVAESGSGPNDDISIRQDDEVFFDDLPKSQCVNDPLADVFASVDENYSLLSKITSEL